MLIENAEKGIEWLAGTAAILSGFAWISWAALNVVHHGGLDAGPPAVTIAVFRTGQLLTGGWNLLLIPAALVLWRRLRTSAPGMALLATVCGVLSVTFWGYGGLTHTITPALETAYLFLSAVWWIVIGLLWKESAKWVGRLTLVLGAFTALDFVFTFFEPVPFWLYLTAAPKLPLAALWSISVGVWLIRGDRAESAR
jgi:hypothetical protein